MEVKVTHTGKMKFRMQAREHVIETDQPVEGGGEDSAMTPPEIFLAALGSCAAMLAVIGRRVFEAGGSAERSFGACLRLLMKDPCC